MNLKVLLMVGCGRDKGTSHYSKSKHFNTRIGQQEMSNRNISSTEWQKFTLIQENGENITLWLAGIKVKKLFGSEIVAIACYEAPDGASIMDIRKEERKVVGMGTTLDHPDGDKWQIILRVSDMVIIKTIGEFHKTRNGTKITLTRVWTVDHNKKPDNSLLHGINFQSS